MIKVIVTEEFTLRAFTQIKNIVRSNENKNQEGSLYEGDVFECDEKMADYLTGNNDLNKKVVNIIEVIPEEVKQVEKTKTTRKTTTKKK